MRPDFFEIMYDATEYYNLDKMLKAIKKHTLDYNESHKDKTKVKLLENEIIPKNILAYICEKTGAKWYISENVCKNLALNRFANDIKKEQMAVRDRAIRNKKRKS